MDVTLRQALRGLSKNSVPDILEWLSTIDEQHVPLSVARTLFEFNPKDVHYSMQASGYNAMQAATDLQLNWFWRTYHGSLWITIADREVRGFSAQSTAYLNLIAQKCQSQIFKAIIDEATHSK